MSRNRARQRSMGNFSSLGGAQRSRVEISDDEDDEVTEIKQQSTGDTGYNDRTSRLETRRQRREAAQEWQFSGDEESKEEWEQLQQALQMSKLEAEEQEERQKMFGTLQDVMNLQIEIEPLSSSSLKTRVTEVTGGKADNENDQQEDTASPELFSTPPEDQGVSDNKGEEKRESDAESPNSPSLPVTTRSPDATLNDKESKEQSSSTEQTLRQEKKDTKRKFKLRRTRQEEDTSMTNKREKSNDDDDDDDYDNDAKRTEWENAREKRLSENIKVGEKESHGEKRKLQSDIGGDDDDVTDDEDFIPQLRKSVSLKRKKLAAFLENSDSEELQNVDKLDLKRASDKPSDPLHKRVAVSDCDKEKTTKDGNTSLGKKQNSTQPPSIRFSRQYKKSRCIPATVQEAMKADLYFAPRGINIPSYTKLIIRMLDRYRKRLHFAQSKVKMRLPWGCPVVAGSSSRTLELRLPGKASIAGGSSAFVRGMPQDATSTSIKNNSEPDVTQRRRSLRSSANLAAQTSASASTSTVTRETLPAYKVDDSDSEGDEFLRSYLDEARQLPSSGVVSSKKAKHLTKNDPSSAGVSADHHKIQTKGDKESSVKKQERRDFDVRPLNDDKTPKSQAQFKPSDTSAPAWNGNSDILFGAGVILDSNSGELQSNTFDISHKSLGKGNDTMKDFNTSKSKLHNKKAGAKEGDLADNKTNKDDMVSMDVDECQSDNMQPPKRRNNVQPFDDDSTDDERDLSQPVLSLHFENEDTTVNAEISSSKDEKCTKLKKSDVRDEVISDNIAPDDSQSVLTQSGSTGSLGKSILDTITTGIEAQGASQSDLLSSNSSVGSLSSTAKRTFKRGGESLIVDIDSDDSQNAQRKRSEAAEKAAAAAERRRQWQMTRGQEAREASPSSSFVESSVDKGDVHKESTIECPLCYHHFSSAEIQAHASDCQGPPPSDPQTSSSQTQMGEAGVSSVKSPGPRAIYQTLTGERRQLKDLKVFLQRSPLAERKLLEKTNQPTDSGKRNLNFERNFTSPGLPGKMRNLEVFRQSSEEGARKDTRTTGAAVRAESESEPSGCERVSNEEVYSWLDSSSPEKKRPQNKYGGNSSKTCDDYIPLETSRQNEDDRETESETFKTHGKSQASRTEEIESCSGTSDEDDDALMVKYGAQRLSRRPRTRTRKEEKQETDENELALAQLGGRKKRPLSISKSSNPKRSRRLRDSDSEDSDESTIVCLICDEKVPKEIYEKHVEKELEQRESPRGSPRKLEVTTVKDTTREGRMGIRKRVARRKMTASDVPSQSSGAECSEIDDKGDINWDAVSDSPIKCFQFTENCTSVVDFQNQFEHLKEEKAGKRRGSQGRYKGPDTRRGYRQDRWEYDRSGGESGSRGKYRGLKNRVYGRGRGKNYGRKSRGFRGKK